MAKKTSIYLTDQDLEALEATGASLLTIVRLGLVTALLETPAPQARTGVMKTGRTCPPHPKGRVLKGFCGRCGRQVNDEKVS